MSTFEIILTVVIIWAALFACGVFAFYILKTRSEFQVKVIANHQKIWSFYQQNYQLLNKLLTDCDEPLTDCEINFLNMLFHQLDMIWHFKRTGLLKISIRDDIEVDWKELLSYPKIKAYYVENKTFRTKSLRKFLDKILKEISSN